MPVVAGSLRRWRFVAAAIFLIAAAASILAWRERQTEGSATASHPEPIPLTFEGGLQTDPSISPDGQWIAYTSDTGGNFDVWIRRLSGGEPVQVTHDQAADYQPDWSPDGSRLVFRSERARGGLLVAPVTGGTAQRISASGFRPRWSPDGREILFADRVGDRSQPHSSLTGGAPLLQRRDGSGLVNSRNHPQFQSGNAMKR